jgi:hypothetical protein
MKTTNFEMLTGVCCGPNPVLLACGSMHFDTGTLLLIYSILGGWAISIFLAIANLILIVGSVTSSRFKVVNFGFYCLYAASALALFSGGFGGLESAFILLPIFGVPVTVISHFVYLVSTSRRARSKKAPRTDPW